MPSNHHLSQYVLTIHRPQSVRPHSTMPHLSRAKQRRPTISHDDLSPNTLFVASSCPNSPKFLMSPAFGALSLFVAVSPFRYAACSAETRACCHSWLKHQSASPGEMRRLGGRGAVCSDSPLSCGAGTRSSLLAQARTSSCLSRHRRLC